MRNAKAKMILAAAAMLLCCRLSAQNVQVTANSNGAQMQAQGMKEPPKMPTAKEMAQQRTEQMNKLLVLDEKQYKEIYEMNLKEAKKQVSERESMMKQFSNQGGMGSDRPMGGPGMGGGMGPGGPGMGGGMGQGGPGMGGGMGQGGPEMGGQMPQGVFKMNKENEEVIEKVKVKKEKQLKKILTPEQFSLWQKDEAARASKEFWKDQNDDMHKNDAQGQTNK